MEVADRALLVRESASSDRRICRSCSGGSRSCASSRAISRSVCLRNKSQVIQGCRDLITLLLAAWLIAGGCCAVCQPGTTSSVSPDCTSTGFSSQNLGRDTQTSLHSQSRSLSPGAELNKTGFHEEGIIVSLAVVTRKNLLSMNASTISEATDHPHAAQDGTDNLYRNTAHLSVTVSASIRRETETDMSKVVGIVVPFACVLVLAGLLVGTFKLCHRYRCCSNEAPLRKLLGFCDGCMSTQHVFQVKEQRPTYIKTDNQSHFSPHSFDSVSSCVSKSVPSFRSHPQDRLHRSCRSVQKSRQDSSPSARLSVRYKPVVGLRSKSTSSASRISEHRSSGRPNPRHVPISHQNSGRMLRHGLHSPGQTADSHVSGQVCYSGPSLTFVQTTFQQKIAK